MSVAAHWPFSLSQASTSIEEVPQDEITVQGCGPRGVKTHDLDFRPYVRIDDPDRLDARWRWRLKRHRGRTTIWGYPAQWVAGKCVYGLLPALNLQGNYEVNLEFEDTELKNWLRSYIRHNPEEALDLIAEMLPLAVEACKKRGIQG